MSAKLSDRDERDARLAAAYYRIVNTPDLVLEFAEMIVKLSEIRETIPDESEQAQRVLTLLGVFLAPVVERPNPLTIILKVAQGLNDAVNGREVLTMFKPRRNPKGGAIEKGFFVHAIKGLAARACTCFAETPTVAVAVAAERVAKVVRDFPGFDETSGKTVLKWREKCMIGEGGGMSDDALAHYGMPLHWLSGSPEQRGEQLIAQMQGIADHYLREFPSSSPS
jgi:hypothetical protein